MLRTLTGFNVDQSSFTLVYAVYSHDTRFSRKLNFLGERARTELGQKTFRYLGPKFWSITPDSLKDFLNDNFKTSIKIFLLNRFKE